MSRVISFAVATVAVIVVTGSASGECRRAVWIGTASAEPSIKQSVGCEERGRDTNKYVSALAHRYYNAEVSADESASILAQIRALPPNAAAEFHEAVLALGIEAVVAEGRTLTDEHWENVAVSRAMYQRAAELHLSVFDLPEIEMARVAAETVGKGASARFDLHPNAIPIPSYCTIKAPYMPNAMYGASCGRKCVNASGFDRASTGRIELGGCDYRFFFPSSSRLQNIDGKTTAADCVVLGYRSLISRFDSSAKRTEAVTGSNVPRQCGVTDPGDYLRRNFQAF